MKKVEADNYGIVEEELDIAKGQVWMDDVNVHHPAVFKISQATINAVCDFIDPCDTWYTYKSISRLPKGENVRVQGTLEKIGIFFARQPHCPKFYLPRFQCSNTKQRQLENTDIQFRPSLGDSTISP